MQAEREFRLHLSRRNWLGELGLLGLQVGAVASCLLATEAWPRCRSHPPARWELWDPASWRSRPHGMMPPTPLPLQFIAWIAAAGRAAEVACLAVVIRITLLVLAPTALHFFLLLYRPATYRRHRWTLAPRAGRCGALSCLHPAARVVSTLDRISTLTTCRSPPWPARREVISFALRCPFDFWVVMTQVRAVAGSREGTAANCCPQTLLRYAV